MRDVFERTVRKGSVQRLHKKYRTGSCLEPNFD
jgi:hypothetical protein